MSTTLDQLAAELAQLREEVISLRAASPFRLATVTAADPDARTADINLDDDSDIALAGVPVSSSYLPEAGHTVLVAMNGLDPVILPPQGAVTSTPPSAVGALTVDGIPSGLSVSWTALADFNVKDNRGYYQVQVDLTGGDFSSPVADVIAGPANQAVIGGLTAGTTYDVRARAFNYLGTAGSWSPTASGTPTSASIAPDSITETEIADDSISTPKLQANAVTAAKIAANTITAAEIAANTITAAEIAAGTITATEIAAGTITATELATLNLSVGQDIESASFVSGSSGWRIRGDGSAEFSDTTVRGTVEMSNGANLLPNPDAEVNLTGWYIWDYGISVPPEPGTLTRDTTVAHSGSASFKLVATGGFTFLGMTTPRTGVTGSGAADVPVVGGSRYTMGAWVRNDWSQEVFCSLIPNYFDGSDSYTGGTSTGNYRIPADGAWYFVSGTQLAPAGSEFVEIEVSFGLESGSDIAAGATFHVDDVSFSLSSTITAGRIVTQESGERIEISSGDGAYQGGNRIKLYTGDWKEAADGTPAELSSVKSWDGSEFYDQVMLNAADFRPHGFPNPEPSSAWLILKSEGAIAPDTNPAYAELWARTISIGDGLPHPGSGVATTVTIDGQAPIVEKVFCKAQQTSAQGIPSSTLTPIQFNGTDVSDDLSMHSPSTNNSRFVVPYDGIYLATGLCWMANSAAGSYREIGVMKNGGLQGESRRATTGQPSLHISEPVECVAGDYIEFGIIHDTGGTLNTLIVSGRGPFGMVTLLQRTG